MRHGLRAFLRRMRRAASPVFQMHLIFGDARISYAGANCAEKGLAKTSTRIATTDPASRGFQTRVASAELILPASALQQNWMIELGFCVIKRVTYEGCRPLSKSQDALQRLCGHRASNAKGAITFCSAVAPRAALELGPGCTR